MNQLLRLWEIIKRYFSTALTNIETVESIEKAAELEVAKAEELGRVLAAKQKLQAARMKTKEIEAEIAGVEKTGQKPVGVSNHRRI